MNFKKYIIESYKKEFSKPAPKHLELLLDNISASRFTPKQFATHFNLDTTEPLAIIEFVMNPDNSYEIGKFGNRIFASKQSAAEKDFILPRKRTTSDQNYNYEQGKFTKKFR